MGDSGLPRLGMVRYGSGALFGGRGGGGREGVDSIGGGEVPFTMFLEDLLSGIDVRAPLLPLAIGQLDHLSAVEQAMDAKSEYMRRGRSNNAGGRSS